MTAQQKLELDAMKAHQERHIKEMFDISPNCHVCAEPIRSVEEATVFTPVGGKDRLVHVEGPCYGKLIVASIGRYMGRGRGGVVRTIERGS